jgi:hypothetical protein
MIERRENALLKNEARFTDGASGQNSSKYHSMMCSSLIGRIEGLRGAGTLLLLAQGGGLGLDLLVLPAVCARIRDK